MRRRTFPPCSPPRTVSRAQEKPCISPVAQCLYRWDGDSCATRVAQGVDGQLAGDADELYALNFNGRTLTRLTFPESGNAVPDEVRTLDSPALLDTAGALRPLRGCAVSGGWLYLLVESDVL